MVVDSEKNMENMENMDKWIEVSINPNQTREILIKKNEEKSDDSKFSIKDDSKLSTKDDSKLSINILNKSIPEDNQKIPEKSEKQNNLLKRNKEVVNQNVSQKPIRLNTLNPNYTSKNFWRPCLNCSKMCSSCSVM